MICIVVSGNIPTGFTFYGPFEDMATAGMFRAQLAGSEKDESGIVELILPPSQYLPYGDLRRQVPSVPYNQEADIEQG